VILLKTCYICSGFAMKFKYDRDKVWLVYTQISPGHIWTTLYFQAQWPCKVPISFYFCCFAFSLTETFHFLRSSWMCAKCVAAAFPSIVNGIAYVFLSCFFPLWLRNRRLCDFWVFGSSCCTCRPFYSPPTVPQLTVLYPDFPHCEKTIHNHCSVRNVCEWHVSKVIMLVDVT
jgi:hypothetical protein